jgi:hypothetical protein
VNRPAILSAATTLIAFGLLLFGAGIGLRRNAASLARGLRAWTDRRWLREDEILPQRRDQEAPTWGFQLLGRGMSILGLLMALRGAWALFEVR